MQCPVRTTHRLQQKLRVAGRSRQEVRPVEYGAGFGQRSQHETIPRRQDFLVAAWPHACGARFEQHLTPTFQRGQQLRFRNAQLRSELQGRIVHVQDAGAALEVARRRNVVKGSEQSRVLIAEQVAQLGWSPDVKLAFFAFGICILGRVEATGRVGHIPQDVADNLLDDVLEERITGGLIAHQVGPRELRVVVQHLLEMWHEPFRIGAVARETTAQVIVDTAARHTVQGAHDDIPRGFVSGPLPEAEQELQGHRLRELGRRAEAAEFGVVLGRQAAPGCLQDVNV